VIYVSIIGHFMIVTRYPNNPFFLSFSFSFSS